MATTAKKKNARKNPSAKQLAWRKKFGRLVRAGAFRKGTKKRNPVAKKRATTGNSVSVRRNGKKLFGAAAQAVLKSRKKRSNGGSAIHRLVNKKRGVARKTNSPKRMTASVKRTRRNPSTGELYEQFQGRAPVESFEVIVPDGAPRDGYVLGVLGEIATNKETITFDPNEAFLVADKNNNLYVGLTKATNNGFDANENLGEIKSISYVTIKDHLEGEEIEYVHKFGEEGGDRPVLIANEKTQLEIVGGDYFITEDGIRD
jgi:hypothetical protein